MLGNTSRYTKRINGLTWKIDLWETKNDNVVEQFLRFLGRSNYMKPQKDLRLYVKGLVLVEILEYIEFSPISSIYTNIYNQCTSTKYPKLPIPPHICCLMYAISCHASLDAYEPEFLEKPSGWSCSEIR